MNIRSLLLVALLLTGCGPASPADPNVAALAEARARWSALGRSAYSFSVELQCYCTPEMRGPFEVTVTTGGTTVLREGVPVAAERLVNVPINAEALFTFAETRVGQSGFRAEYDQVSGLPTAVWSDPIPEAADDELGMSVASININQP